MAARLSSFASFFVYAGQNQQLFPLRHQKVRPHYKTFDPNLSLAFLIKGVLIKEKRVSGQIFYNTGVLSDA